MFGMRFDGPMRSLRRNGRGLSEIVGTLMLVIIVVSAATLLAAFIASYQKQLQTEETFSHDQSLESIKILGLVTVLNASATWFNLINFTIASEYIYSSTVLSIAVNNVPLSAFWWKDLSNHSAWQRTSLALSQNLVVGAQQEIDISTNASRADHQANYSYNFSAAPLPNQYVKIDVYTLLQNDFSRVFLPPVGLAVVSNLTLSPSNWATLLDGSQSFQPGGNATIVQWNWNVTPFAAPADFHLYQGEEVEVSPAFATTSRYWVNLTVTNSVGLIGTTDLVAVGGP